MRGYLALTGTWRNPVRPGHEIPRTAFRAGKPHILSIDERAKIREALGQIAESTALIAEARSDITAIFDRHNLSAQQRGGQLKRSRKERG